MDLSGGNCPAPNQQSMLENRLQFAKPKGFTGVITATIFRFYVVSYCTPARTGTRELTVDVTSSDDKVRSQTGRTSAAFEAKDFGPNCHSNTTPNFVQK
jgi:hypothetical protein